MGKFVHTTTRINFNMVQENGFSLSSSQYVRLDIPNKNVRSIKEMLERPLSRADLGSEVGSLSYIEKSPYYFIRTKALQEHSFLPDFNKETVLPILPSEFVKMELKEGDIIISKDSNIGESVILDKDYPNCMLSGAMYKLPVLLEWKYYLLGFLKHDIFREQLDFLVPKGATIRHAKTLFLDCMIPLPNKNTDIVIRFVSLLVQSIINKERLIKQRHAKILELIEDELINNQKPVKFEYRFPTVSDLKKIGRMDTNMYNQYFKSTYFQIVNYSSGHQTIEELGFHLSRGQNLQVSNIGKSVYSKDLHCGFYTLVLPKYLSKYGTIQEIQYLGNKNKLKTLNKGDLIFGAEGFEKGRSVVIIEEKVNAITNIHGITLVQIKQDVEKAIFVKCFLDFLREKGMVDLFAVGGNGGSLAQKYWPYIQFPKFPALKQHEIVKFYYNPKEYESQNFTIDSFLIEDEKFNQDAGIYEIDKTVKHLKEKLNKTIDDIISDREVKIEF